MKNNGIKHPFKYERNVFVRLKSRFHFQRRCTETVFDDFLPIFRTRIRKYLIKFYLNKKAVFWAFFFFKYSGCLFFIIYTIAQLSIRNTVLKSIVFSKFMLIYHIYIKFLLFSGTDITYS